MSVFVILSISKKTVDSFPCADRSNIRDKRRHISKAYIH